MSAIARSQTAQTAQWATNGNGRDSGSSERREVSDSQIRELINETAQQLLSVDGTRALAMLDSGELEGTQAGESLRSLRWLLEVPR